LLQYVHRRFEERFESWTDRESNVSETTENWRFDASVKNGTLESAEEYLHEPLTVIETLRSEGSTDISNESDRDRAELVLLVRFESVDEIGKEGSEVRVERSFESRGHRSDG
jgi:hypothetical protein